MKVEPVECPTEGCMGQSNILYDPDTGILYCEDCKTVCEVI